MVKVAYRGYFRRRCHLHRIRQGSPSSSPARTDGCRPRSSTRCATWPMGETKRVRVGADEGVRGEARPKSASLEVERAKIPADIKLAVGDVMSLERPDGQTYPARLVELDEERAVFDLNHDAIAKALNFEITLLDVRDLPKR